MLALPTCESHYPAPSHTLTGVNHVTESNLDTCQGFKRDRLGLEEPGSMMTDPSNALKISYFQVFQPEPSILNYGTPPSYLDNSRLGAVGSRVHNTVSNHMSTHLVLNSAQYHTLLLSVRNVFRRHRPSILFTASYPMSILTAPRGRSGSPPYAFQMTLGRLRLQSPSLPSTVLEYHSWCNSDSQPQSFGKGM